MNLKIKCRFKVEKTRLRWDSIYRDLKDTNH